MSARNSNLSIELSSDDRLSLIEASGYFYEISSPVEKHFAAHVNALVSRIATSSAGGLTLKDLEIIRACLELYIEDFPSDSQPQQSLLSRLPQTPPFA